MSSISEKMGSLKRIVVSSNEDFVIEVNEGGIKYTELLFSVSELTFRASDGKSNAKVIVYNPNGFGEQETTTVKYSLD